MGEDEEALGKHLIGLRVQQAFGLYLGQRAVICELPKYDPSVAHRQSRQLAMEWQHEYKRETFHSHKDDWAAMLESPDGYAQSFPQFVVIEMDESRMKAHQMLCDVQQCEAKRVWKNASLLRQYPRLRELFIASQDQSSPFHLLPQEIIYRIAFFVAPYAFFK